MGSVRHSRGKPTIPRSLGFLVAASVLHVLGAWGLGPSPRPAAAQAHLPQSGAKCLRLGVLLDVVSESGPAPEGKHLEDTTPRAPSSSRVQPARPPAEAVATERARELPTGARSSKHRPAGPPAELRPVESERVTGSLPGRNGASAQATIFSAASDGVAGGDAHAVAFGGPGFAATLPERGAQLSRETASCSRYFPSDAAVAYGTVRLQVEVNAEGRPGSVRVLQASNAVFQHAALTCARQLRFVPARDPWGNPKAGRAELVLSFRAGADTR